MIKDAYPVPQHLLELLVPTDDGFVLSPAASARVELLQTFPELPPDRAWNSFSDEELAMMQYGNNPRSNAYLELLQWRRWAWRMRTGQPSGNSGELADG